MNGMTPYSVKENKKSIVKSIAEKSDEEVAAALMQDPRIKKFIFEELRSLDGECENLCKPSTQFMLRLKTVEQLSSISWEKFVDEELEAKAHILHKIAVAVACTGIATSRNVRKTFARKIPVTLLPHLSRIEFQFNSFLITTRSVSYFSHSQNLSHHVCMLPQVDQQTLQFQLRERF